MITLIFLLKFESVLFLSKFVKGQRKNILKGMQFDTCKIPYLKDRGKNATKSMMINTVGFLAV